MKPYKIAVVEIWHCGEIYSAGLAELGHDVVGIDGDQQVITNLENGIPPLPEPGLEALLRKNLASGNLRYTTDFGSVKGCDVIWFTFDTPVDDDDNVDTSPIYRALETMIPDLRQGVLLVMTSQVPVGTAETVRDLVKQKKPELEFDYAYVPENLRLSEAVRCFMEPGRTVVGATSDASAEKIKDILSPLHADILRMSPASAEMAKHALNAYLATSISFINDIADLCEAKHADVLDVVKALRSDPRIGPKAALAAGLGFSGGTLGRDLKVLKTSAKENNKKLSVIESVLEKNVERKKLVVDRLSYVLGDLKGKTVALFGLTYKPGTKTLRRSRSLEIARDLAARGAILRLCDPAANEAELPAIPNAIFSKDPYEAASSAVALVVITPWPEFRDLDFKKLAGKAPHAVLFDTSNLFYDKEDIIKNSGFTYFGVGRSIHGT